MQVWKCDSTISYTDEMYKGHGEIHKITQLPKKNYIGSRYPC